MEKIQLEKAIIYKSVLKFNFFALCEKKILKCDENFINLKKDEPLRANAVNLVIFTNALCHFNATPLSVAVLAPCAWGENLACGVAWQSVVNSAKQAQRIQCGKPLRAKQRTANLGLASVAKWAVFASEAGKAKMGRCLGGDFSLSLSLSLSRCSHFLAH